MLRFISWNVNGMRACVGKNFLEFFEQAQADFFCVQETKLQQGQIDLRLPGYCQFWNYAEKKGYAGTAVFAKHAPLDAAYGIGLPEADREGRVITLNYPEFFLVTVYTPNAQDGLRRLSFRMEFEDALRGHLIQLNREKPVVVCGDLNVAHREIDLKNPKSNRGNAGFSDEERAKFTQLLESGFLDTFRWFHPDLTGAYSWWSYRFNARKNNAGWRIDYFLTGRALESCLRSAKIHADVYGSDHCPVELELELPQ